MELCKGGELLERILSRGGKYSEEDAKTIVVQILSAVAFFHLQGIVHRDLKPENFLFVSKNEKSTIKAIDFGLSDFVNPDERLNDIVGSAYYVAPEVLHRSYGTEADMWSVGVIAYILLCGSRPFWARTESGIFRAVLKAKPSFEEDPWPSLSSEARDFIRKLLNKDHRKRLTASQALSHPWLRDCQEVKIPLDISIYRLVRTYICSSSLRKSALRALAKTLTVDQLFYLREQFALLSPSKSGFVSLQNFRTALMKNSTKAMEDSRVLEFVDLVSSLQHRKLDFEEFVTAAINVYQLEGLDCWEQRARDAYEFFDKDGNRPITIQELASAIKFVDCSEPWVRDLYSVDSAQAHILILGSQRVNLSNLKLVASGDSPNTDGIHIHDSQHILIEASAIHTGDDCISVGDSVYDVHADHADCGPGHGIWFVNGI